MKSITKTFLKTKKKYEILELLVTNFARTHSELPKQPIVHWGEGGLIKSVVLQKNIFVNFHDKQFREAWTPQFD